MVEANVIQVAAEPTARGALLRITFDLKFTAGDEMPLSATGYLMAPHNVIVCPLTQAPLDQDVETSLRGDDGYARHKESRTVYLTMVAALGRPELDHIADLRSKDPKGDVHFTAKLGVRCLLSSSTVTYAEKVGPLAKDPAALGVVLRERPAQRTQALVGEYGAGFIKSKAFTLHVQHRIPANDWVQDFAPHFGVGKFSVFEIPEPKVFGTGPVQERASKALEAARKAEDRLRAGQWTDACTALRPVWELIRDHSDIRALLLKDGYTADAAQAFDKATDNLFQFSSKFMHAIDRAGNLIAGPDIKASKEEAYLVFTTAMAVINLVTQKAR
jgi:hypothetical protein